MNWYKTSKKVKGKQYSWTYINLPKEIEKILVDFGKEIDPEDLFVKEADSGLEKEPHVTIKYAILTNEVKDIRERLEEEKGGKFYLGESSMFETPKYDVIKIEVESKDLKRIHNKLNELPHEDKYPDYNAHATIAYLKKGKGKKYVGKFKINNSFDFKEIFFGDQDKKDYKIKLASVFNLKDNSKKKDIPSIANKVRIEQVKCHNDDCLKERCLPSSRALRKELIENGYDATVVQGIFRIDNPDKAKDNIKTLLHYWVEVDGLIVDITASQFNDRLQDEKMNPTEIGTYSDLPRYTYIQDWI